MGDSVGQELIIEKKVGELRYRITTPEQTTSDDDSQQPARAHRQPEKGEPAVAAAARWAYGATSAAAAGGRLKDTFSTPLEGLQRDTHRPGSTTNVRLAGLTSALLAERQDLSTCSPITGSS